MKKWLLVAALFCGGQLAFGQAMKVLLDITSKDTGDYRTLIRHVKGFSKEHPDAQLQVVIYGGAIAMALKDKSVVAADLQLLSAEKNVAFTVCGGTMKRFNIDKSQLLPGIKVVPDAMVEMITKQQQGWAYIKEAQ